MSALTFVITGRGARIKHISADGAVLCPSPAAKPATGRFEKLPVCGACETAAANEVETGEEIEISARRVLTFRPSQVLKNALNDAAEAAAAAGGAPGAGGTQGAGV